MPCWIVFWSSRPCVPLDACQRKGGRPNTSTESSATRPRRPGSTAPAALLAARVPSTATRRAPSPLPLVLAPRAPAPPGLRESSPAAFPAAPTPLATRPRVSLSRISRLPPRPPAPPPAAAPSPPLLISFPPPPSARNSSPCAWRRSPSPSSRPELRVPASPAPLAGTTATPAQTVARGGPGVPCENLRSCHDPDAHPPPGTGTPHPRTSPARSAASSLCPGSIRKATSAPSSADRTPPALGLRPRLTFMKGNDELVWQISHLRFAEWRGNVVG